MKLVLLVSNTLLASREKPVALVVRSYPLPLRPRADSGEGVAWHPAGGPQPRPTLGGDHRTVSQDIVPALVCAFPAVGHASDRHRAAVVSVARKTRTRAGAAHRGLHGRLVLENQVRFTRPGLRTAVYVGAAFQRPIYYEQGETVAVVAGKDRCHYHGHGLPLPVVEGALSVGIQPTPFARHLFLGLSDSSLHAAILFLRPCFAVLGKAD